MPGRPGGKVEKGDALRVLSGIVAGNQAAAKVVFDHGQDGLCAGGFKEDIRNNVSLLENRIYHGTDGGFPVHQHKGLIAQLPDIRRKV